MTSQPASHDAEQASPFSQEWLTLSKQEKISLIHQANYWKAQHALLKQKIIVLEEQNQYKDAKIKDLQSKPRTTVRKRRSRRIPRPDLPVILQTQDLAEDDKKCAVCGLPHLPTPALDESNDYIEVEVRVYILDVPVFLT